MLALVIYDISQDKARKKVADHLLDLGLVRTQYSVFLGTVDKNRLDELVLFAESQLDATDKLYVIPVQRDDLSAARVVGLGFDEQLVTDEILTKVI
ncbi:MAG: CRISPR-associated endonuclease Cas2 [Planctomycetales bacterium]|nr:CRISPR-associated endonuclease Cas2 [Planctomycetales bacterium]